MILNKELYKLPYFVLLPLIILLLIIALNIVYVINNRSPNIIVPTPVVPNPNGWDDFQRAKLRLPKPHTYYNRKPDVWTHQELEAFRKDNAQALSALREGLGKPYLHPPMPAQSTYIVERELARRLRIEAVYYENAGNYYNAASSWLDCIEFGVVLPKGGSFITSLTGGAIESIGTNGLGSILGKLTPRELELVANRLERIMSKRTTFSEMLIYEGIARTRDNCKVFKQSQPMWKALLLPWQDSSNNSIWLDYRFAFANKAAIIKQNEAYYKKLSKEQCMPYTGTSNVPVPNNPLTELDDIKDICLNIRRSFTRNEAVLTLLQTQVALQRYNYDKFRYPDKLSQLVPVYLKSIKLDPFGYGKSFKYKPIANGKDYLLYSIGPNMKDEKGSHGDDIVGMR